MTKTTKTPIEVTAEDIKKIGGTAFGDDDGFTHILCDLSTANIEEILLRSILKCFGEEYRIVACEDWEWDNGIQQIEFVTNLPWESYMKVSQIAGSRNLRGRELRSGLRFPPLL